MKQRKPTRIQEALALLLKEQTIDIDGVQYKAVVHRQSYVPCIDCQFTDSCTVILVSVCSKTNLHQNDCSGSD